METRCWLVVIAIAGAGLALGGCSAGNSTGRPDVAVVEPAGQGDGEPPPGAAAGRHPPLELWWHDPEVVTALGLSDDQVDKIGQLLIVDPGQRTTENRRERRAGLSYLRALSQDPYDQAVVEQRAAVLVDALSDTHQRRLAKVRALRDILTREQWMKLWEVAPRAVQVSRFFTTLGPRITVADGISAPPGHRAEEDAAGDTEQTP